MKVLSAEKFVDTWSVVAVVRGRRGTLGRLTKESIVLSDIHRWLKLLIDRHSFLKSIENIMDSAAAQLKMEQKLLAN